MDDIQNKTMPNTTEHTHRKFDADLEAIRTGVLHMGGLVETQVAQAMEGLKNADLELLNKVIEADHQINLLEVELAESCNHIIAKRQPAAVDLRLVLTVIKSITDLERIGDEAKKIAKAARRLHTGETSFIPRVELGYSVDLVLDMLRSALNNFARADVSNATSIRAQDEEVSTASKASCAS